MGRISAPRQVKLFTGMLCGDRDLMRRASQLLKREFGPVDLESDHWMFEHTDYYEQELGTDIEKYFVSFETLINPDRLVEIKRLTNDLENKITDDLALPGGQRPINLDPGYISLSKMVLATTKDHAHRIYMDRGIYGEVTLHYRDHSWQPWPWTYPDYASGSYNKFFEGMRETLKMQLTDREQSA